MEGVAAYYRQELEIDAPHLSGENQWGDRVRRGPLPHREASGMLF
jgi:hypothetical protein